MLTELEAKTALEAYGIAVNPTRLAESKADARKLAAELGLPLVMKIASPDIVHKSRAGCVRLGLDSVEVELLVGVKKDPHFGPALLFGWGGVHTEALGDWNIALGPLNRLLARRLMEVKRNTAGEYEMTIDLKHAGIARVDPG